MTTYSRSEIIVTVVVIALIIFVVLPLDFGLPLAKKIATYVLIVYVIIAIVASAIFFFCSRRSARILYRESFGKGKGE